MDKYVNHLLDNFQKMKLQNDPHFVDFRGKNWKILSIYKQEKLIRHKKLS